MSEATLFEDLYGLHRAGFSNAEITPEERGRITLETRKLIKSRSNNRLLSLVLNNPATTLFEEAEKIRRRKFAGYKKYLPCKHDEVHNRDVDFLQELAPNSEHLKTHSLVEPDNPITGMCYGILSVPVVAGIAEAPIDKLREVALLTVGGFTALGLALNISTRNRRFGKREDFDNARVWDTMQYLDMVINFERKDNGSLAFMDKQMYAAPLYRGLTEKQRRLAYDNIFSNPFIRGIGVSVAAPYQYGSTLKSKTTPSPLV